MKILIYIKNYFNLIDIIFNIKTKIEECERLIKYNEALKFNTKNLITTYIKKIEFYKGKKSAYEHVLKMLLKMEPIDDNQLDH